MAWGGTTTHIDFCYVRPGDDSVQAAIEQRAARWKGNSYVDYAYHITLSGDLDLKIFEQIPEAIRAGYPSFKVFTTNVLPPHPKRHGQPARLRPDRLRHGEGRAAGGLMVVHGEDEDLVQFNYERFRAEGRMDGTNMHLVHTKLSELLAFRRTVGAGARKGAAVYFVHTSAKEGVDTIAEARAQRPARLRGDAAPVRVLQRRVLQDAARVLLAHLSVAQVSRGPGGALARAGARRPVHAGHRRVPDEPRAEAARGARSRTSPAATSGAEARMGIAYSEGVVKRGMTLAALRRHHSTQCREDLRALPEKGAIAAGSDADLVFIDPAVHKTLGAGRLPRDRLQPVGGLGGHGLAGDDACCAARSSSSAAGCSEPPATAVSSRARSIPSCCAGLVVEGGGPRTWPPTAPHASRPGGPGALRERAVRHSGGAVALCERVVRHWARARAIAVTSASRWPMYVSVPFMAPGLCGTTRI